MLTPLLLSCLLLPAALADNDAARPAPAAPQADLVTVVYDLDRLWTVPRDGEQQVMRVMPFTFCAADEDTYPDETDESLQVDNLTTLLWQVVAPGEFDYEGRRLEPLGEHG